VAALLRCFAGDTQAYSLSDLARQAGLNVSTTYRLAKTLCAESLLSYDRPSERYRPGLLLARLGRSAMSSTGLTAALPVIQRIADSTGETAALNIRQGRTSVSVLVANSAHDLRVVDTAGVAAPLHVTAAGKALLAFGDQPIPTAVKAMGRLERLTDHTLTTHSALRRDLEHVAVCGYSVCDQERDIGVRAVGSPVLDGSSVARAAVGIQGPVFRIPDHRVPELGHLLAAAAKECAGLLDLRLLDSEGGTNPGGPYG